MSRDQERARADRLARLAGLGPVLAGMVRRVQDGEGWRAWAGQVEHAGHCAHPVRITGRADAVDPAAGEAVASFSTDGGPDGVLLVACGDRGRRSARRARTGTGPIPGM
nr:replication initiator [Thermomonospora amylolytica]